jgi:hypothetical protein
MSEAFTLISALYYIAEISGRSWSGSLAIEHQIDELQDASEWFAASMCVEDLRQNQFCEVRWSPAH